MPFALEVTDAENGGGFTASLPGQNYAVNPPVLLAVPWTGSGGAANWTALGAFPAGVDDPQIAGTLTAGFYLFQAVRYAASDYSNVYYRPLVPVLQSMYGKIIDAALVRARSRLPDDKIEFREVPFADDDNLTFPQWVATTFGQTEGENAGPTLGRDELSYPLYFMLIDDGANDEKSMEYIRWRREKLARALRHQSIVTMQTDCVVEYDPVLFLDEEKLDWVKSALLFRFMAREPRGLLA